MVQRKTLEIWVGLFVAAGIFAIAVLAFRVGNLTVADVSNGYPIMARFDNIGGLKVKSAVTMAGVRVGRVAAIGFDSERYQAVVTMNIDGRFDKIPTDTSAAIFTSGLLGEQYVGLEPGGSEEYMKAGDALRLTQSAVVLEKLIGQFLFSKAAETPDG
ncbi:MAG TPA: outer membrane lipid asymmetry maintenance protein MlaD, partial [Burkholderiales bacterium]